MQTCTVTLERVFDLQRRQTNSGKYTEFGFEALGQVHYSIRIAGWPELTNGHTITAILFRPDNWKSLLSWVNLTTREVVAPEVAMPLVMGVLGMMGLAFALFMRLAPANQPMTSLQSGAIWIPILCLGAMSLGCLVQGAIRIRVSSVLRMLSDKSKSF